MTIARTICLGFVAVIAIGTLLLILPFSTQDGSWNNPIIALFTSTSAVCVTGLVVVDTGTYFSFWGQLIIMLLIQVGGLGYMTTTTFLILLVGRRFNLRQKLAIKESFDRPFLQGNSQNIIQSIIATTLLFELAGVLIMLNVFSSKYGTLEGLWLAIFHSVSAWNNAGFGLLKDNLMSFTGSWSINFAITMLIIFGGIGYQVIIEMYLFLLHKINKRQERIVFSLNFKVATSTTLLLLLGGTAIFFLVEFNNPDTFTPLNLKDKILAAWFQSVTSRTAGFNTIDIGQMTIAGLFTTMGLMFIGASPGGTGGGIKTTTLRILSDCTRSVLRGNNEVVLYGRQVPIPLVLKAVAVVFGSANLVIFMTFSISFIEVSLNPIFFDEKFNSLQVLFEVISAFATVGLSTGITASLSSMSQILLVITMYTGRVGVLLLMAAIVGDTRPRVVQYPEETLLVG
ncbi:TrkH family potassium uptake protein [Aphanothece sacrum]|uniref:Potassium uptake protein, TrkH family n=1 Tax=Aphanothece sacrum FPU1 TaxID=1920663 RepID=A0A401II42_APHSA|nr:TrkH family potassium uptake protein [Aphanothece sacrum]GBF80967.1 hypothetical protein AsFPU1_2376 [Aphanothece sacrum FPU1]GBF85274.1 K+ transporter [Aphanothece sacrum FPU3]